MLSRRLAVGVALLFFAIPGTAEQEQQQQQAQEPQEEKKTPEIPTFEELVVVTASKVEEALINAPATMSVIRGETIQNSPAQNYGDLLRSVPGLNVSQTSARDINLTSRGATSTLATSQLALLDGRSIYQDFFGFVLWDFLPVNTGEIKQIEIIRGPASAVWGANALTGVVNIITKSPREMQGTTVTLGFGGFGRSVDGSDEGTGALFYLSGTHARAVSDRFAYKISAALYTQDALPRPSGNIPNAFGTPYPPFENQGTTQPKVDARFDYDFADGRQKLILGGGLAGTEGIIHSGIGPFDIDRGSVLGYGKVNYSRGNLKLNFFVNVLDGEAPNLLTRGSTGAPLIFTFKNQTYDVELGDYHVIGTKHLLSYGGNFRHNSFDLSIAPRGDNRNEGGGYVQDEIFISDHFRWIVGGRLDKFDVLEDPVFSPRTTFLVKPRPDHTFRVSYNRAYRAPSLVNNFLDTVILNEIDLGLISPALRGVNFVFPIAAVGNEDLKEESLTAYEVGYTGVFAEKATLSLAYYLNDVKDNIDFAPVAAYDNRNPPPGWPLPPFILDVLIARGAGLPSRFSYRNIGKIRNQGVEVSVDASVNQYLNLFANYSWQKEPDPEDISISEINIPPRNRFNAGFNFSYERFFGNFSVNFADQAVWTDVLDSRFWGPTDSYTLVNAGFGVRWAEGKITTAVKATNLANQDVQQHVFGDILKRQVAGEVRFSF